MKKETKKKTVDNMEKHFCFKNVLKKCHTQFQPNSENKSLIHAMHGNT